MEIAATFQPSCTDSPETLASLRPGDLALKNARISQGVPARFGNCGYFSTLMRR